MSQLTEILLNGNKRKNDEENEKIITGQDGYKIWKLIVYYWDSTSKKNLKDFKYSNFISHL